MQKLEERDTYTPTDAPQVRCNCDPALNREETLSVLGLKTSSNNSEVDISRSEHRKQDLRVPVVCVYVLNMRGKPLMPTNPAKAKKLLKQGKAKVVKRKPFTIQLKYATGEAKQPIRLGIDPNYTKIGYSAVTDKKELSSGEVVLRDDVSEKLTEKSQYRRGRRNKHHWYREARFDNRCSKQEGWLAPSIKHKIQTYITLIEKIGKILPVSYIIIEVASFDTQKMVNPEISGAEYQQGELRGYEVREYLLEKFGRTCAYCGKTDLPLEVEHIVPRSRGGSGRVSNLTISCHKCNRKKGNKTAEEFGHPEVQEHARESLKSAAFMNSVRWKLVNTLNCDHTYGYITKHNRIKLGLEKSHVNDAFVIARGNGHDRVKPDTIRQNRRNNRALQLNRNGFKPSIRRTRYRFQPDIVRFNGSCCSVKGVFSYGKAIRLSDFDGNILNTNINNVELIQYGKGLQYV